MQCWTLIDALFWLLNRSERLGLSCQNSKNAVAFWHKDQLSICHRPLFSGTPSGLVFDHDHQDHYCLHDFSNQHRLPRGGDERCEAVAGAAQQKKMLISSLSQTQSWQPMTAPLSMAGHVIVEHLISLWKPRERVYAHVTGLKILEVPQASQAMLPWKADVPPLNY